MIRNRWLLGCSGFFFVIWLILFSTLTVPEIGKYRKTMCQVVDIFYNESVVYPCDCEKYCRDTECNRDDKSCYSKWDNPRRWDQTQGDCCDGYYCAAHDPKDHSRCTFPIFDRLCEITCPKTCYDYNVTWVYEMNGHGYETIVPEQFFSNHQNNKEYVLNETKPCYVQKSSPQKLTFHREKGVTWILPFTFLGFCIILFLFWIIMMIFPLRKHGIRKEIIFFK